MREWKDIDATQELPHTDVAPTCARMGKTSLGPFSTNSAFCGVFEPWTVCYFPHHSTTRPHVTYSHNCKLGQEDLTGLLLHNLLLGDRRRLVSWGQLLEPRLWCWWPVSLHLLPSLKPHSLQSIMTTETNYSKLGKIIPTDRQIHNFYAMILPLSYNLWDKINNGK
jgi:hypothetical protein